MERMNRSRGGLVVAALAAVACQTYDFEPVKPLAIAQTTQSKTITAQRLRPNVMMLLDKSGSMNGPIVQTAGSSTTLHRRLRGNRYSLSTWLPHESATVQEHHGFCT